MIRGGSEPWDAMHNTTVAPFNFLHREISSINPALRVSARDFVVHFSINEWWAAYEIGRTLLTSELADVVALAQIELAFRCGQIDDIRVLHAHCEELLPGDASVADVVQRAATLLKRRERTPALAVVADMAPTKLHDAAREATACWRWQDACLFLERLVAIDPKDAQSLLSLARAWSALGDHAQVAAALERVIDIAEPSTARDAKLQLIKVRQLEARRQQGFPAHAARFIKHPPLANIAKAFSDDSFVASASGKRLRAACILLSDLVGCDLIAGRVPTTDDADESGAGVEQTSRSGPASPVRAAARLVAPPVSNAPPVGDETREPSSVVQKVAGASGAAEFAARSFERAAHNPDSTVFKPPTAARPLRMPGAFLHAKRPSAISSVDACDEPDRISVQIEDDPGWVRVLFGLFNGEPPNTSTRISIRIPEPMPLKAAPTVGVGTYDAKGVFRILHRWPRLALPSWESSEIEFKLTARILSEIREQLGAGEYYLFVEFSEATRINLGGIAVAEIQMSDRFAPYRDSTLPICGALLDQNHSLALMGKRALREWLLKQARLAIRLECFETAGGSLRLLDSLQEPAQEPERLEFLRLFAEVAIADGRVGELRERLLDQAALTRRDDQLWTALSLTFPAESQYLPTFGRLPSGKLNRFFLSRLDASGNLLDSLLGVAGSPPAEPEDNLLMASQFRRLHPPIYRSYWNRYLGHFGLAPIAEVSIDGPNVLKGAQFARPAASQQGESKVSVVMSAFNAEETIDYAIRSILRQTHGSLEMLVCDDASSDGTFTRMMAWRDHPAVRLFRSKSNQGPYNVRNALIAQATGQFLTFHDADDLAHPQRLERQLSALRTSGAKAVVGYWVRVRPNGDVVFFRDQQCLRMSVVSLLAETEFFRSSQGYRQVLCGGDTEVLERLKVWSGQDAVAKVEQPLILGLWSSRSLTRMDGLEATEDGYRALPRRQYAEAAARRRLLGTTILGDDEVDRINQGSGIFRPFAGAEEIR